MVNLTPQLELAAAVVFPRNWLQVLGSIEAHQCLGIEKRTKINRWNSGSESCTGVGVVVGFIVSKSKEMVDLTMALFAKFWVNGNQDALISLLG
jgi:hypothetical protein